MISLVAGGDERKAGMTLESLGILAAGFVALIGGAELLVRGSSRLAAAVGISPLIIGLTVVAFGTSAPEFAVSLRSGLAGSPGIALGNVVGSNIFNILFILGLSALIVPLNVARQVIRLDVPFMIFVSILVLVAGARGGISRAEGAVFFAGLLVYTLILFVKGRREGLAQAGEPDAEQEVGTEAPARGGIPWALLLAALGLVLLVIGSRWLVTASVAIATALGVSELIIGLTIVAVGTSLPELATSVVAGLRGERDIAVGIVVGSNVFNILGVLGLTSLVSPHGMTIDPMALRFDIPVMIAAAIVCLPIVFTRGRITRLEGALLLGYYVAYIVYLILSHTGGEPLFLFRNAMIFFALPLSVIGVLFSLVTGVAHRVRLKR